MNTLSLAYTGERVVPDHFQLSDRILQEHLARYRFAAREMKPYLAARYAAYDGLKYEYPMVLDAPCGVGYGSALLAEQLAVSVHGIDIDRDTIKYATNRYGGNNVYAHFAQLDMECGIFMLPQSAVVCFEGIEHVKNQESVAQNLCALLEPRGMIFVSTPRVHGPGAGSTFHTRELTLSQFEGLFAPHLSEVKMYGQELHVGDCEPDENARFYVLVGRR